MSRDDPGASMRHPSVKTMWQCLGLRRFSYWMIAGIGTCAVGNTTLSAADIKRGFNQSEAVLEGQIEPGDCSKLREFVHKKGARSIYLASPGGNLAEAIEIGRLVRALKLEITVPSNSIPTDFSPSPALTVTASEVRQKMIARHKLENPQSNYMCASACFFVFVAGVSKITDGDNEAILGVHRPYLSDNDLRALTGNQAITTANQLRAVIEEYLNEMGAPSKYANLMMSVPKDKVRWISSADFEDDFRGFMPELKDWIGAKCDTRTDLEKAAWENLKDKRPSQMTAAEKISSDLLFKKMSETDKCGSEILAELSSDAWVKLFGAGAQAGGVPGAQSFCQRK